MSDFELSQKSIAKAHEMLPEHMVNAVVLYFNNRIAPGDFLTAVLEGDLFEALSRADDINVHELRAYGMWLYNYAPGGSYGSPEKVERWLEPEKETA